MPDERQRPRRAGAQAALRTAAVWASVSAATQARRDQTGSPLLVLDLGGGSGGLAVPLAVAGHDVVVVDPSPDALASLRRRADETDAGERVTAVQGDAESLESALQGRAADLVCCHGTLELVDDPAATLERISAVLAPGGFLSLLTAQRVAAVLTRALAGRFDQARAVLDSADGRWGGEDPAPRRFERAELLALVEGAGLETRDVQGVRIFTDLVPSEHLDSEADRAALLELEQRAASHPALADLGSSIHVLAARP